MGLKFKSTSPKKNYPTSALDSISKKVLGGENIGKMMDSQFVNYLSDVSKDAAKAVDSNKAMDSFQASFNYTKWAVGQAFARTTFIEYPDVDFYKKCLNFNQVDPLADSVQQNAVNISRQSALFKSSSESREYPIVSTELSTMQTMVYKAVSGVQINNRKIRQFASASFPDFNIVVEQVRTAKESIEADKRDLLLLGKTIDFEGKDETTKAKGLLTDAYGEIGDPVNLSGGSLSEGAIATSIMNSIYLMQGKIFNDSNHLARPNKLVIGKGISKALNVMIANTEVNTTSAAIARKLFDENMASMGITVVDSFLGDENQVVMYNDDTRNIKYDLASDISLEEQDPSTAYLRQIYSSYFGELVVLKGFSGKKQKFILP